MRDPPKCPFLRLMTVAESWHHRKMMGWSWSSFGQWRQEEVAEALEEAFGRGYCHCKMR